MSTAKAVITSGKVPRKKGSGAETMRSKTVAMKTILDEAGGGTVLDRLDDGGLTKVAILQKLGETDHTHGNGAGNASATVGAEVEKHIIAEQIGGKTPAQISAEYGVQRNFVQRALARRFGSAERAKQALLGLCLENGLALQEVVASKIQEFSGPQAVLSSAVLIDKALAIEKSIAETPKTIDFGALRQIGHTLSKLREITPKPPA